MTITTAQDPKQQHREEIKRAKFFHKISSHPANIDKPQFKELILFNNLI